MSGEGGKQEREAERVEPGARRGNEARASHCGAGEVPLVEVSYRER